MTLLPFQKEYLKSSKVHFEVQAKQFDNLRNDLKQLYELVAEL